MFFVAFLRSSTEQSQYISYILDSSVLVLEGSAFLRSLKEKLRLNSSQVADSKTTSFFALNQIIFD